MSRPGSSMISISRDWTASLPFDLFFKAHSARRQSQSGTCLAGRVAYSAQTRAAPGGRGRADQTRTRAQRSARTRPRRRTSGVQIWRFGHYARNGGRRWFHRCVPVVDCVAGRAANGPAARTMQRGWSRACVICGLRAAGGMRPTGFFSIPVLARSEPISARSNPA
ncbi:hypothetical protein BD413DRAFT_18116 [Trametes elegans]|nr:hypothetical protein BD413DRAFT_18116 [Trametes elegans]